MACPEHGPGGRRMYRTMERMAVVVSFVGAFGTAICYSAPVWVTPLPAQDAHGACRLRLEGALEGGYACSVEEEVKPGRLGLRVTTAPNALVQVQFRAELEPSRSGGGMSQAQGTTLQALVRQRIRADVGAAWLGPDGLEVQAAPGDGPVRLRLVLPPAPENPDRRAVEVQADVGLSRLAVEHVRG
jgi:hypothetical protein